MSPKTLEHRHRHPPLPARSVFFRRLAIRWLGSMGLIVVSLGIGVLGYRCFAGLSFVDALLNASMILTGMGPVDPMITNSAKIFASLYALFSGVAFLTIIAVMIGPIAHRFLHRFHLELEGGEGADPAAEPDLPAQSSKPKARP